MDRCRRSGDSCDLWQFLFAQAWSASRRRRKREIVAIFGKSRRARNRELNFLGQWISAASSGQCWSRARPNRNSIEFCSGAGNFTAKEARRAGQSLQRSVVVFLARQSIIPSPHSPPLVGGKHPPRSPWLRPDGYAIVSGIDLDIRTRLRRDLGRLTERHPETLNLFGLVFVRFD
jgi:hypothetical protein